MTSSNDIRRTLIIGLTLALSLLFVVIATPQLEAGLVGQFTFEPGEELVDKTGLWNNLELKGNATITPSGELDVNGGNNFATGWAATTGPGNYLGAPIGNKTLVSWVTLQGLANVARAGSALTIDTRTGDQFDGIIFSEQNTNRWMNGSNGFSRTMPFTAPLDTETTTGEFIQMAISYQDLGGGNVQITGYRNGVQIGQYNDSPFATWSSPNMELILGKRHGDPNNGSPGGLDALIEEVQIWDEVLSQSQIQALTFVGQEGSAVPEPSTAGLGLLSLAGCAVLFWRKRTGRNAC